MASVIGSLRAELSATVATFQRDLGKAADSVKGFATEAGRVGKDFTKIGRQMESVGANLTKSLTLPFAGLATAAILAGKTVDEALDTIRAGTGATGDRLEELGQSFRKVFKDLPNSAQQVADAITEISQRTGLAGKPLEDLTIQVLNLSRLTKTELTGTVTTVTRVFGDWSIATADQSKALDFLFRTSQQTGIEFGKLSDLVVQFGAPMRALGFSFEETTALMGKFEKEGVNLETVMSGLRFALGKFAKAGVEPEAAFKQVSAAIKNAKTESEATAIAFDTFGKRAAIDMSRAIIEGRFAIDDLVSSLSTGKDGINAAAEATLSASEKFNRFKNNVIAAIEPLGKRLTEILEQNVLPMVQRVVEVVGKMVDVFVALPHPVQNALLVIAAGLAALGPGLFIAGQLVTAAGSIALAFGKTGIATRALLAVLEGAGGLVGGLKATTVAMEGAAVASKSFQLAMAGVVGLIVGGTLLVALKLYNDELERQQRVSKTGPIDGLKDAFGNLIVPIGKATTEMGEWSGKVEPMGGFVKVATKAVDGLGDAIGPTAEALAKGKKAAEEFAKEVAKFSGANLLTQARQMEQILKAVGGASKLTQPELRQVVDAFQAVIEKYRLMGPSGAAVVDHFSALLRTIAPLPETVHALERGLQLTGDTLAFVGRTAKPTMQDLDGLALVSHDLVDTFSAWPRVAVLAGDSLDEFRDDAVKAGNGIKTGLLDVLDRIPETIVHALTGGGGLTGAFEAIGSQMGEAIGRGIGEGIGKAGGAVSKFFGSLFGALGSLLGPLISKLGDALTRSQGERVMKDVGARWGVQITEALGDSIAETAKALFKGSHQIAETFRIGDIIEAAGGLSDANIKGFTDKFRDVFVFLSNGTMTAAQAAKVLDENFQQFADHFLANGKLISAELVDIVKLNEQWGAGLKVIAQFVGQQAQQAASGLQAFLDKAKITSQQGADAIASAIAGAFAGIEKGGLTLAQAVAQLDPLIESFVKQLEAAGFTGGDAFNRIRSLAALMKDEVAGPAIEAIVGLGDAMAGLHNIGLLDQATFSGLASQITETFNGLVAQGKDGFQFLSLLKDPLQTLWELSTEFGLQVDEATQALLDQAVAAGIVGAKMKPVQEQMLDATNRIVAAVEKLADVFTGKLPNSAAIAAGKIQGSLDRIKAPDLVIDVSYNDPGPPRYLTSGGNVEGFADGSGGVRDFGAGTLVMLHGREAVETEAQLESRRSSGRSVTLNTTLNFTGGEAKDAQTIARETVAAIRLGLVPEFWSLG